MKLAIHSLMVFCSLVLVANAAVTIDEKIFGKSLGGWQKLNGRAAEYTFSGTTYRTYRPEVTPTPDGGIFVSLRIDHVRGWLSSNDHAVLEVTLNADGLISSAQSNIALQGRSISSDVILGTNEAGKQAGGADHAVQIGTDLVADLSAKLLREKLVEAGRVSFPSVLRHNYNLLYQAVRLDSTPTPVAIPVEPVEKKPATPAAPATPPASTPSVSPPTGAPANPPASPTPTPATPAKPGNAPLEIKPYAPGPASLPTQG